MEKSSEDMPGSRRRGGRSANASFRSPSKYDRVRFSWFSMTEIGTLRSVSPLIPSPISRTALSTFRPFSESVNRAAIVGDAGVIVTDSPVSRPQGFTITVGSESRHESVPHGSEPYSYQLREATRCVQQGLKESPTMPLASTLATMELFDEIRRRTGVTYPNDYPEE